MAKPQPLVYPVNHIGTLQTFIFKSRGFTRDKSAALAFIGKTGKRTHGVSRIK